jgi:hypothetical protein
MKIENLKLITKQAPKFAVQAMAMVTNALHTTSKKTC